MILLLGVVGYKGFKPRDILVMLLFYVGWILEEMMVFLAMEILPMERTDADLIGVVISKIIAIIGVHLFSVFWKRKETEFLPLSYFLVLLFIPIGSIYIAVNQFYQTKEILGTMITFGVLLLFNILILEIYGKLSQTFMLEKEKAIYAQHIEMMGQSTEEQQRMMENFHRERHDWINQLIVLKNEIEDGEIDAVTRRIDKIIDGDGNKERILNCGNRVIDAIINAKYIIARQKGVEFKLKVFVAAEMPIDRCDLGVVLGNALDNAIEATEKCERLEKKIMISIGIKKESLVILVENPYEHELKKDRSGNLISTKKDKEKHGYGINSIRKIADKYEGEVLTEAEKEKFSLIVLLNLREG